MFVCVCMSYLSSHQIYYYLSMSMSMFLNRLKRMVLLLLIVMTMERHVVNDKFQSGPNNSDDNLMHSNSSCISTLSRLMKLKNFLIMTLNLFHTVRDTRRRRREKNTQRNFHK